jgi:hypothetical protein
MRRGYPLWWVALFFMQNPEHLQKRQTDPSFS